MTTTTPKYRGSTLYDAARNLFLQAARARTYVTYSELADLMKLPPSGHYMSQQTGIMAGEISEEEHAAGRPMLSAILVHAEDELPGPGFYRLAQVLGKKFRDTELGRKLFWEREREAVYAHWQAHPSEP